MPPQRPSIFMESVAGRHDMFPGSSIGMSPNLNISGLPGMDGPEGALVQMFLEPMLTDMLGPGFVPGQFKQTHNLYDHYRRKAQFQSMQTTMSAAGEADQGQYLRLLRGMAATAGVEWNSERERAAQAMATDMSKISPMLAQMMPDTFDRMHGSRGSATVMAQSMFQGGRYRIDPVSGMLGTSADSTAEITKEMYERLYGPGADLSLMKGVGAGRAGQMFDELSRRGLAPRTMSREEQLRGIAKAERGMGATEEDLGKAMDDLRNLSSPQLEMKIRQFEAGRIGDRVKNMAGAVAAMRDVFGEMGQPDAPMSQLIEGLQVLTQGGLATMSPEQVENIVRDSANVARRTGMGLDNMTMLMAASAQRADAMGLDRRFGVTAGVQSAAFGSAYANTVGGSPAWGRGDKERMMAVDSQLRLNAANSSVANQLAATMRIGDDVGFKAGSEAAALQAAVKAGETTYEFGGRKKSVHVEPGRWRELMTAGGVDAGLASAYRSQTAYNQRFIDEKDLTDVTRRVQADVDVAPRLDRAFQRAARQAGVTDADMMKKIGQAGAQGLLEDIAPEDMQNPDKVADYLAGKLGVDKGDAEKMAQLRRTATLGWGNIEQMVKTNPRMRGYKSADQLVTAHRRATTAEGRNQMDEARQESRLQSALSGLGSGSALERLVDAVGEATPGTSTREVIAKTLGWVPEGEVGQRLEGTVQKMEAEIKKFRDTDADKVGREAKALKASGTEDDKKKLQEMADKYTGGNVDKLLDSKNLQRTIREEALGKIKKMSPELRKQAEDAGLELGATASTEDAAKAWTTLRDRRATGFAQADALAEKVLFDDRSLAVLGPGGLDQVKRIQDRNREIRELAGKAAGGDVGNLMATDEQRKRARDAYGEVTKGAADSKRLEKEVEEAEARGDTAGANKKREELEGVNKRVTAAQGRLTAVGRELGTDGEKLAKSGAVDPAARAQAERLRAEQMGDLKSVQEKLRAGKRGELTPEQKKAAEAERGMRRKTDAQVMDDIAKTLGMEKDLTTEDRAALAKELRGDRAHTVRQAVPALKDLREMKRGMTDEQFREYLAKGPGAGASAEELAAYHKVAAGRTGGGLAGLKPGGGREAVAERLRDFSPGQKDPAAEPDAKKTAGGKDVQRIEGTITIPGLGEGRLNARGSRA